MSDQLVFKDALKTKQKNDGWSEALSLQKENRKLKSQLEDVDNLLEEIENALNRGPDNDWARHAIDCYNNKYYE